MAGFDSGDWKFRILMLYAKVNVERFLALMAQTEGRGQWNDKVLGLKNSYA